MPISFLARNLATVMVAAALFGPALLGAAPLRAQGAPDNENGRFSFSPASDGSVLRLDTRTGNVSNCSKRDPAGWACYSVPDERAALDAEIGRLQADNTKLKDELKQRSAAAEPSGNGAPQPGSGQGNDTKGGRRLELQLPSDQDIDRAMAFLERAWRRLVDAASKMHGDVSGKI
jgi:hypothetical protein